MTHRSSRSTSHVVAQLLHEYGGAVRERMMSYLPQGRPRRYLYGPMAEYPRRGGRGMRPTLCLATARLFGGSIEDAVLTAVSIELMHNAMLIHDDIEDGSEERRGRPSLHHQQGVPLAINTGDALALFSMRPLFENRHVLGPTLSLRLLEESARMSRESAEGQAMELGWRHDNVVDLGERDYLEMVLKKTCWLATIHPLRAGALIGAGERYPVDGLIRFGFLLGAAFQIQDDLLNLAGDPKRYGKELSGDIYEGKRTLMLIRLLERGTPDERGRLRDFLALPRERRGAAEVDWVRARMHHYDCIDHARALAHALAGAATHEFEQVFRWLPDGREKRFIAALPRWVIERS
ncbi:All-trans-nonaprenyl-diphosphate synthase [Enhygromyxa salina]|uniref:All-trans-nonaprenyl-diphosphate synthase n=1 Tax=Enhygromyxa salina TaxID=215803 RepID=A0A2S9YC52_9BACT|nr:All-trans-nonaprenyl-diphosphate synthase [Enhygromyxa salina]